MRTLAVAALMAIVPALAWAGADLSEEELAAIESIEEAAAATELLDTRMADQPAINDDAGDAPASIGEVTDDQSSDVAATVERPAASLTPHSAVYKVRVSGISGRLSTTLTRDGERFSATHQIEARGLARMIARGEVREASTFSITAAGVVAGQYESSDTLIDDSDTELKFDWTENRVTGRYTEPDLALDVDEPLDGASFDRVSIQYSLMLDMARGTISGDADAVAEYVLIEADERKPLQVRLVGERSVKTGAGRFDAVGVQHQTEGSSRRVTLWLAPELDYLPVLIEQHKRDKLRIRATLDDYRALPTEG